MTRTALVRGTTAAALAVGLSVFLIPLNTAAADGDPQEVVVPAASRTTERSLGLLQGGTGTADATGPQGVFHTEEGLTGRQWTRFSDGMTFPVAAAEGTFPQPTGSDSLAHVSGRKVELRDAADGSVQVLTVPEGLEYLLTYGSTGVAHAKVTQPDGTSTDTMHLLSPDADGATRDVLVTGLPKDAKKTAPVAGDDKSLVFLVSVGDAVRLVLVDRTTGVADGVTGPLGATYKRVSLTPRHLSAYSETGRTLLTVPRADVSAAPSSTTLEGNSSNTEAGWAIVGDWMVYQPYGTRNVRAVPLGGGTPITLLERSATRVLSGPEGTAVTVGGSGPEDWAVRRITEGTDGRPALTTVKNVRPVSMAVQGISLAQGQLIVTDASNGRRRGYVRNVSASGTPHYGARTPFGGTDVLIASCGVKDPGCAAIHGVGDGRIAWLERNNGGKDKIRVNGSGTYDLEEHSVEPGGTISDMSVEHLIHTSPNRQSVFTVINGHPSLAAPSGAAAVRSGRLWTPGTARGSVTALDLATKKTVETVDTGAGCVPTALQAVENWLYWSCADGPSGVYDRSAKKSVGVPSGEAMLGDGYVVTHDKQAGKLNLTRVDTGAAQSRVIGDLPDTGVSQRNVRWTVDQQSGHAAYVDSQQRVHIVPSGITAHPPLSTLAESSAREVLTGWHDTEWDTRGTGIFDAVLSKPASDWALTVRSRTTGQIVDQRAGGDTRGRFVVQWAGMDPKGDYKTPLPTGDYTWDLTVNPADGQGPALRRTATVRVADGAPVRRDHAGSMASPDGTGDLLTLSASGELTYQHGTGTGKFSGRTAGGGWATSAYAVPFGDVNGDRCNDVLVRLASGELRAYKPGCGAPLTPSTAYTSVGTGWSQYNVLTSPGDMNGDGLTDLVARQASTGDMYFYAGTSAGKFKSKVRIGTNWKTYGRITGVGDITGDGKADLLGHDKSGGLWRYDGLGNGTFKGRTQVFKDWGRSYNALVGVGDITGDGKADIVARDSAGKLFRNAGDGRGSFKARAEIATGWQGYRGLF